MTIAQPLPRVDELGGYVTVERAGEILGVSKEVAAYALKQGNLSGVRLGGKLVLVKKRSLERLARQRRG